MKNKAAALVSLFFLVFIVDSPAQAKNYALVIAGASRDAQEKDHHQFALEATRQAIGLKGSDWQTTVFYSPKQGRTQFHDSPIIEGLPAKGIALAPADKASVLGAVEALAPELHRGDKVYLSINAHGNKTDGSFTFDLVDSRGGYERVKIEDLVRALEKIRSTGARLAVAFDSCNSGDIPKDLLTRLRGSSPEKPAMCVITMSYENTHAEACMENDFGPDGKLKHPENQSHTSALSFVSSWLYLRGGGEARNPFTQPEAKCWGLVQSHYAQCLAKAARAGIALTPASSLKDVLRAGRVCDTSVNMPDSTGRQRALGEIIPALGADSRQYLYGRIDKGRFQRHEINPHSVEDLTASIERGERALAQRPSSDDPYALELERAVAKPLAAYRENLARQKHLVEAYTKLLATPPDFAALRRTLGPSLALLEVARHEAFLGAYPVMREPEKLKPEERIAEPGLEEDRRVQLIYLLQDLVLSPKTPAADRARLAAALSELQGGDQGASALRELVELRRRLNTLYSEFLALEREAYERTIAKTRDACDDFTF